MRVIDTATPPGKGGWVYIDPETKVRFQHPYFSSLKHMAAKHRRANQLPIPVNWDQFFESNICENTTWGKCEPEEVSLRGTFRRAKQFATEMANWARSGFHTVDKQVLQDRYDVCQGNLEKAMDPCPHWGGSQFFGTGRCNKCGCSGLKLYLATSNCPIGKWSAIT